MIVALFAKLFCYLIMTSRNPNLKTELLGVRYVEGVVQNNHSIFHSFLRENDQGNDCYIEFVKGGIALNYGVFAQLKSGISYKDNKGYKIPTDKAHLNYWSQALYQTVGIVYDPEINKAFWVDISAYLKVNPQVLEQEYHSIRVEATNEFSEELFSSFIEYCFDYREAYMNYENYGRSLEWFADIEHPDICYEGLKSLYSNHRNRPSAWFYIISSFSKIKEEGIRRNILGLLSNYTNNPHVFWHSGNIQNYPSEKMKYYISQQMTEHFRAKEIELTLPYLQEGINRGSFSFIVLLVIDLVKDAHLLLKEISFNEELKVDKRNFCFWLYMQLAKFHSVEETLETAHQFLTKFPCGYEDEALLGVRESIQNGELWPIG
ncbi:DUF4365 domain-containing protein [Deminuibacter soli]|uniref:DUF4365 domain-containing protein n=1 Tax=Deminuibacter soli TaxID=2291815 RepID=A0A3E1NHL6_9BACT|nr:DUF4365 domain-containing protein [Deminuibacter soli]RFM27278.1 DUF4365 domain-containing protein [Deminuibacter soli]